MIYRQLIRQELPQLEVFVQSDDRSLAPASDILADDVRYDLTRNRRSGIQLFHCT
jgi:hypothetical protein